MVQYLKRISLAGERLERMVSDLLKLSRAGRKTGKFNEVDINSVVKTSLKHFESSIIEKHIDVKLTPEFPTVSCDRSRIIEVFDNLIANAVRFAGSQEKPKIKIGWKKQKDQYQFWVEDNGVGIIEGDKKKIFKTFVQGSLVSSEEGTGVGLSIAKKVIESHGGRIWVKSELGSGATFYFTIPL
jgi:signal transduction histidine kinase